MQPQILKKGDLYTLQFHIFHSKVPLFNFFPEYLKIYTQSSEILTGTLPRKYVPAMQIRYFLVFFQNSVGVFTTTTTGASGLHTQTTRTHLFGNGLMTALPLSQIRVSSLHTYIFTLT